MRKKVGIFIGCIMLASMFTGCSQKTANAISEVMNNQIDVALTVDATLSDDKKEPFTWTELDSVNTHEKFRKDSDSLLNVVKFGEGSKNGPIYIDTSGNWSGNNTFMNAFSNKEFVKNYWEAKNFSSGAIALAGNEVGDQSIESWVNTYYNLLPNYANGESTSNDFISRKEAMALIVKADTPVMKVDASEFDEVFGYDEYNECAYLAKDNSYLSFDNGSLNAYTYNSPVTYGEIVYMVVSRYYGDELQALEGQTIDGVVPDAINAGDIIAKSGLEYGYAYQTYELETCLQNLDRGMPEDMYKAYVVACNHGIVSSGAGWNDGALLNELIRLLYRVYTKMYTDATYPVNSSLGKQAMVTLDNSSREEEETGTVIEIGEVKKEEIAKVPELDEVFEEFSDELELSDDDKDALKEASRDYTWELEDEIYVVSNCNWLNVRYGPGTEYDIIKSVPCGTEIHVIARCVENGWYRVVTDGVVAYQSGTYLSKK